ncbi:conserved hypothetical protein [Mycobacterium tuberculosis]|nr:hypothetical protein TMCG_01353 [Mycobacterium tuberculosis SUMu003]SIP64979.1 conserved hypothetical protein [Mycobacterium tuberculosis]
MASPSQCDLCGRALARSEPQWRRPAKHAPARPAHQRLRKRNGARDGLWKNPEDLTEHQNAKLSRSSTQRRPTAPVFGQRRRE